MKDKSFYAIKIMYLVKFGEKAFFFKWNTFKVDEIAKNNNVQFDRKLHFSPTLMSKENTFTLAILFLFQM